MRGKNKCKILREIRRQIAGENDIPFVTEECRYKGDCKGTCPKCESELRYLEEQLEKRRRLGRTVTVSAVALGMMASMGGCGRTTTSGFIQTEGDVPYVETEPSDIAETLLGEIAPTEETEEAKTQETAPSDESESDEGDIEYTELEGDVACAPETEAAETLVTALEGNIALAPESENGQN